MGAAVGPLVTRTARGGPQPECKPDYGADLPSGGVYTWVYG